MDDPELAALRAKRLAELRAQSAVLLASCQHGPNTRSTSNKAQEASPAEDEQRRRQQQEREQVRQSLLSRILSSEARQRCINYQRDGNVYNASLLCAVSRIAMVRPERALALENFIINAARSGQLQGSQPSGQLSEADLVSILERIVEREPETSPKITFQRRSDFLDDEEDD